MNDFLITHYSWIKAIHIVGFICWMAGLLYLPRLFVYHVEKAPPESTLDGIFQVMEYRLLRYIMAPASLITWLAGLCLALMPGIVDWSALWPYTKGFAIISLTLFHHWLVLCHRTLAQGKNKRSGKYYRIANEIPTALMILIVLSVVFKF
ncbi:MAG: protoporphyrinogen oxidase HemJ [Rhodobacteraceae bacterium]|nr:protoporphyrinogen oxidase HemJ [Paracoccaceae bacterium]